MASFAWLLLFALTVVALLGLGLLVFSVRGCLVSTHPHCRGCKFDLVGLPLDGPEARCPECGRDLKARGSVRPGLRKLRRGMLVVGAALFLAPIALVSFAVVARAQPNINTFKPDFWLMFEVQTGNPATATGQLAELLVRMQTGSLGKGNTDALIERALAVQADVNGGWNAGWGDILDFAAAGNLLSDEQLRQNARNAPRWTLALRSTVTHDDDWVVSILMNASRVGSSPVGRTTMVMRPRLLEVRTADETIDLRDEGTTSALMMHPTGGGAMTMRKKVAGLSPGTLEVTTLWEIAVASDFDKPDLVKWTEERKATITVLPSGSRNVELVADESVRAAVLKSLTLPRGIGMQKFEGQGANSFHCSYLIDCTNPPTDMAFELLLRERLGPDAPPRMKPREWKIGDVSFARGTGSNSFGGGMDVTGFDAASADLILRPSADVARGTLGIYKVWDGEVWFRDVPINDPTATQRANSVQSRGYQTGDNSRPTPLPEATSPD